MLCFNKKWENWASGKAQRVEALLAKYDTHPEFHPHKLREGTYSVSHALISIHERQMCVPADTHKLMDFQNLTPRGGK